MPSFQILLRYSDLSRGIVLGVPVQVFKDLLMLKLRACPVPTSKCFGGCWREVWKRHGKDLEEVEQKNLWMFENVLYVWKDCGRK